MVVVVKSPAVDPGAFAAAALLVAALAQGEAAKSEGEVSRGASERSGLASAGAAAGPAKAARNWGSSGPTRNSGLASAGPVAAAGPLSAARNWGSSGPTRISASQDRKTPRQACSPERAQVQSGLLPSAPAGGASPRINHDLLVPGGGAGLQLFSAMPGACRFWPESTCSCADLAETAQGPLTCLDSWSGEPDRLRNRNHLWQTTPWTSTRPRS